MKTLSNQVTLIGRLGNDPQVRTLSNGNKVARMRLATNEGEQTTQEGRKPSTQWHNLVAWAIQASIAEQYLSKGRKVKVEGKLLQLAYTDKAGIKRYRTDVKVHHIVMLDSKPQAA